MWSIRSCKSGIWLSSPLADVWQFRAEKRRFSWLGQILPRDHSIAPLAVNPAFCGNFRREVKISSLLRELARQSSIRTMKNLMVHIKHGAPRGNPSAEIHGKAVDILPQVGIIFPAIHKYRHLLFASIKSWLR